MFLVGFGILSGGKRSLEFFGILGERRVERWKTKWRGLLTFIGGIVLVMSGWGFIGMIIELFGFINLYATFFPLVFSFLRSLPVIGTFLNLPYVSGAVDTLSGKATSSMV